MGSFIPSKDAIPPHIQKLMQARQTPTVVSTGPLPEPPPTKGEAKLEKSMHEQFAAWLRINERFFQHFRMDKRPTVMPGWPDFQVFGEWPRTFFVEFKVPGNKPSAEQVEVMGVLSRLGFACKVCHSAEEAILFAKEQFK